MGDFDVSQRLIKTKMAALMTQTIELESFLARRNLLSEELAAKLDAMKQ